MKRALAFAVVALFVGIAGLAQISGTWEGSIDLLPSPGFGYTALTLKYSVAGFDLTSYSKFESSGFTVQKFEIAGTVGPADVSGVMGFDPSVPAYAYTDISSTLSFGGVDITSKVFHGIYPYGKDYFEDTYDYTWTDICSDAQTGSALMFYTLGISADPLSITAHFSDCCTGIEFYDLKVELSKISLCCGLTYDAEVYFTKVDGFKYAKFSIDNLFSLCCGISFSASVEFGVDYKSVSISPSWEGIEGCVTVYGDLKWSDNTLSGWELKAWKIYCEFAECNKLTIVTALDPDWYNANVEDVFQDDEFEYLKVETCGAGCCGGNWSLSIQTFFQASGSLFGITRTAIDASVPVMSNLSISISMEVPANTLSIGWSFSF